VKPHTHRRWWGERWSGEATHAQKVVGRELDGEATHAHPASTHAPRRMAAGWARLTLVPGRVERRVERVERRTLVSG
jgi:hypothetical protein